MPKDKPIAPAFRDWSHSRANPLFGSTEAARYFTADALEAAFEAGQAYQKRLHRESRVRLAHDRDFENIFESEAE